ncbi:hypothetical protein [Bradyrhizobium sp. UFLA05-112]
MFPVDAAGHLQLPHKQLGRTRCALALPLPTQRPEGIARCFCGELIKNPTLDERIHTIHRQTAVSSFHAPLVSGFQGGLSIGVAPHLATC